ncbi:hypothetical protein HYH02_001593 [Chlamydomonas schloesseri]|uniref:CP-type G domain-containing protein n=1 Tax=Chlamydomonas schloesseri TaxID=2026947 RepID=A0A836BC14_9CHLO|nr:hypothetical protein HYH02_001593 [Chlamydomonas schloesseri]|eukprot:KAG2453369.1 hypothetical protein HYH02_001593 [Chlamydomonas schloesseri]
MPKKSTKSKSKRMTLKQKYKILKKVREHHRKARKAEKKNPKTAAQKKRALIKKDPGLPAQWPYKDELVKEFQFLRAKALAEEKQKKDERRLSRQAADAAAMDADGGDAGQIRALAALANRKEADFETRKRARLTQEFTSDADNSRKAFYKEFRRVVELSDVIIQVLDARDPLACRCPDVERYIRSTNPNKKIILLLNKMDLVPREVGERWLKYFREELPTVAFKCSTQQQSGGLGQRRLPKAGGGKVGGGGSLAGGSSVAGGSDDNSFGASATCLGADTLLQLLKNYTRNLGIKTAITVGVVGLPNVGKSSLINSLKRQRVAQVGNTPGVTKSVQEVVLDKHIKLLDSPGVVFADADSDAAAALRNAIKVERLADPISPVGEILKRVPAKQLMVLYKISTFSTPDEFLQLVSLARGKLRRGGTPDAAAAARIVLQDWNDGRIPYYTLPPERPKTGLEEAVIVSSYAQEFNADEVFANERSAVIAHLPTAAEEADRDGGRAFFEAPSVGAAKADLAAMEEDEEEQEEGGPSGMDADDDEDGMLAAAAAALRRREAAKASGAAGQAAALYDEEGQFNPHAARSERKKLKKARLSGEEAPAPAPPGAKKEDAKGGKKKPHAYGGDSDDADGDFDFDAMNKEEAEAMAAEGSGSEDDDDDDDEGEGEGESGDEDEEEGSEDEDGMDDE